MESVFGGKYPTLSVPFHLLRSNIENELPCRFQTVDAEQDTWKKLSSSALEGQSHCPRLRMMILDRGDAYQVVQGKKHCLLISSRLTQLFLVFLGRSLERGSYICTEASTSRKC